MLQFADRFIFLLDLTHTHPCIHTLRQVEQKEYLRLMADLPKTVCAGLRGNMYA